MRLFLVDSSIYIFKSWYGYDSGLLNNSLQPNNALVGFTDFVYRLLTEQSPTRIVFAFDESLSKGARKQIYPDYKANRPPAPEELKRQFRWCQQWLQALGLSWVASDEWEADDLIGSLARWHKKPGVPVAILTADKDLMQLIGDNDIWWSYLDNRKLDHRAIQKKMGVAPEKIAEWLALTGDKVDNIPGIPLVGPKTATNLLKKFGSIENLRSRLDEVGEMKIRYALRVQQSLQENENILDVSPLLTAINCEIESMQSVNVFRQPIDRQQLTEMLTEHNLGEMRTRRWLDLADRAICLE